MNQKKKSKPKTSQTKSPRSPKQKNLILFLIIAVLIQVSLVLYWTQHERFLNNSEDNITKHSSIDGEYSKYISYETQQTDPELKSSFEPYYTARLSGNTVKAKEYFVYGDSTMPFDDGNWPTQEWPLDLTGADIKVRHISIDEPYSIPNQDNAVFMSVNVVAVITLNNLTFEELTSFTVSWKSTAIHEKTSMVEGIDYRKSISKLIKDTNNDKYTVISSPKNAQNKGTAVVVASMYGEDVCNQRFHGVCTFLVNSDSIADSGWKVLDVPSGDINEIGADSYFVYNPETPNQIMVSTEHESEYGGVSNIVAIDLRNGSSDTIIEYFNTSEETFPDSAHKSCATNSLELESMHKVSYKNQEVTVWLCTGIDSEKTYGTAFVMFDNTLIKTINGYYTYDEFPIVFDANNVIMNDTTILLKIFNNNYGINLSNQTIKSVN